MYVSAHICVSLFPIRKKMGVRRGVKVEYPTSRAIMSAVKKNAILTKSYENEDIKMPNKCDFFSHLARDTVEQMV